MTAIAFTEDGLLNAKRALNNMFPDEKSTHLTEALAAACGYKTHAALRAGLKQQNPSDPDFVLLDEGAFVRRLNELIEIPIEDDFGWFEELNYPSRDGVIRTQSDRWDDAGYRSSRARAWRNAMVAGINAGIGQRHFTIRAGDNRWPEASQAGRREAHIYRFEVDGIPAIASVRDAGFDELSIHVALWPTIDAERWVKAGFSGFLAGEVWASGWLERRDGAWLQFSKNPEIRCRQRRLAQTADLEIRPRGFADRGNFKL